MAKAMDDIITVENFAVKLSPFDPSSSSNLYGLVDMGSNGIRFSISDLAAPRSRLLQCVYRERAGISLYDALHESTAGSQPFYFSADVIERVAQTLARFKGICERYGVPTTQINVFATEAMRTAKNKDDMLQAIEKASGLKVDILSPSAEGMFGAMGARSGFHHVDGIFMDLGGGSVQMTYINSNAKPDSYHLESAIVAESMPHGAAKLTNALSNEGTTQSVHDEVKMSIKQTFDGIVSKCPGLHEELGVDGLGVKVYLCGGGFRGFGSMLMHTDAIKPYPIPIIGGYTVSGRRLFEWEKLLQINAQDGKICGMSKRRRQQFPAIVAVIRGIIDAIPHISQVTFCNGGNREGVLFMKLPEEIRESNPLSSLLPRPVSSGSDLINDSVLAVLFSAIPPQSLGLKTFTEIHLRYLAQNIWINLGGSDQENSTTMLHNPISGSDSHLPGYTHEFRAILSLIVSARWGNDLGSIDKELRSKLLLLLGTSVSWWCDYIGTVARLLSILWPAPVRTEDLKSVQISAQTQVVGKKTDKITIVLRVRVSKGESTSVDGPKVQKMFQDVGKGLRSNMKAEAYIDIID